MRSGRKNVNHKPVFKFVYGAYAIVRESAAYSVLGVQIGNGSAGNRE
jgi:hypothetical protein